MRFRFSGRAAKATTGEFLQLDIAQLALDFQRASAATVTWANGAQVDLRIVPDVGVELVYRYRGEEVPPYRVLVTTTTPHYGGVRYWWRCPTCGRRVRILYGGRLFECRRCHDLTYTTRQVGDLEAAERVVERRLRTIAQQLGAEAEPATGFFGPRYRLPAQKPPRMHLRTYHRLMDEACELIALLELIRGDRIFAIVNDPRRLNSLAIWRNYKADEPGAAYILRYSGAIKAAPWRVERPRRADVNYWTLGQLAKAAGVSYAFAQAAQAEQLIRPDWRSVRKHRYRRRLATWLAKLETLRQAGMTWEEIRCWTQRRFRPGHEHERAWPDGMKRDA